MTNPSFKNKKTLILFCGILQIVFGVMLFGLLLLLCASLFLQSRLPVDQQARLQNLIPAMSLYGIAGVIFFILGIGNVRLKKWARSLSQMLYGVIFVGGWMATLMVFCLNFSIFIQNNNALQNVPEDRLKMVFLTVKVFLVIFCFVFMVLIPGLLFLAFKNQNVKATFASEDAKTYWTERLPLPVLTLVLLLAGSALTHLFNLSFRQIPFFNIILTGPAAAVYAVVCAIILTSTSFMIYKQKPHAWKFALGATVLCKALPVLSFLLIDLTDYYRLLIQSGRMAQQIAPETMVEFWHSSHLPLTLTLWFGVQIGFVLYTRRFFNVSAR